MKKLFFNILFAVSALLPYSANVQTPDLTVVPGTIYRQGARRRPRLDAGRAQQNYELHLFYLTKGSDR
jgi:hypothetical protein